MRCSLEIGQIFPCGLVHWLLIANSSYCFMADLYALFTFSPNPSINAACWSSGRVGACLPAILLVRMWASIGLRTELYKLDQNILGELLVADSVR